MTAPLEMVILRMVLPMFFASHVMKDRWLPVVFSSLHLELFMSILSHLLYSFSCHMFTLSLCLDLFAPLIVSFLQALVDNTYLKEYTNNNEGSVVI
jgi:hypothetical protein